MESQSAIPRLLNLELAGGTARLDCSGVGDSVEVLESNIVQAFCLRVGTIHIKRLDVSGALCGRFWPEKRNGQNIFTLPFTEDGIYIVHGDPQMGIVPVDAQLQPGRNDNDRHVDCILLEDTSCDSPYSEGGFSCGSPEFEGGSGSRRANAPGRRNLCLEDYPVEPIGTSGIQDTEVDNAPGSPDVTTPQHSPGPASPIQCPPCDQSPLESVSADSEDDLLAEAYMTPCSPPRPRATVAEDDDSPFPGAFSIMPNLMDLASKGCTGELASLPLLDFPHTKCRYLPREYDGNQLYEVPPVSDDDYITTDISFDGHPWIKSNSYNSARLKDAGLRVRKSLCAGAFECKNIDCPHIDLHDGPNTLYWDGRCHKRVTPGKTPIDSDWRCSFCHHTPYNVHQCSAVLWIISHDSEFLTRAVVHAGTHSHPSAAGRSRGAYVNMTDTIHKFLDDNPWLLAAPGWVGFRCAHKNFFDLIMQGTTVEERELLNEEDLVRILEDAPPYHDKTRVKYVVTKFRSDQERCILALKRYSRYCFIQESHFPGQSDEGIKFVFKMSTVGIGSGVDLVKRMTSGDLQDSFVMFDHVKRIHHWTTMAAHVYDHNLQRLLTIAVCEMKLENTENQIKFWNLLNSAVQKRGMPKPKFKGFMADAAPANYNAVRAVYGLVEGLDGNPDDVEKDVPNPENPILRTCYFHFVQSIRDHTNKWILEKYRVHHVEMCKRWASAPTNQEFRQIAEELEEWWQTSGAVQKCNVKFMLAWKTWWMARRTLFAYHHVNELDLDLESEALIPTTNLCEPVHSSMWATSACGYKVKMDLYTVCAEDMTRSLLQQQFCLGASRGQLKGSGPSKADLLLRSAARSHRPEKVAMAVKAAVKGTEFHSRGVGLEGELDRTQSVRIGARLGRRTSARSHRPDKDSRTIRRPLKDQPESAQPSRKRNASQVEEQGYGATFGPSANRYSYSSGMAPAPFGTQAAATSGGQPRCSYQVCSSEGNNPSARDFTQTQRQGQTMAPLNPGNHWQYPQTESHIFNPLPKHAPYPDRCHNQQSTIWRPPSLPLSTQEYLTNQILSSSMNPSRDPYMGSHPLSTQEFLTNQILSPSIPRDSYMEQTGIRTPVPRANIPHQSNGQGNHPIRAPHSFMYQPSGLSGRPHLPGIQHQQFAPADTVLQFGNPVLEREIDHNEWAIRRSLPGEDPKCSAYVDRNGRWESCGRPLKSTSNLSVAAPSFYGTCEIRFTKSFQIYWFCPRSASGCVVSDHVLHMRGGKPPKIPRVWPVDRGTKLNTSEANELGRAGFLLVDDASVEEQLKLQQIEFASNVSPMNPLRRPPRRAGKRVNRRSLTDSGESRRENGLRMAAQVRVLSQCKEDSVYTFNLQTVSTTTNKSVNYVITISETPSCTCPFFVNSVSDHKPGHFYMTCKHMYHIYNRVLGLPLTDERPHQATLSRAEVEDIMKTWRPTPT